MVGIKAVNLEGWNGSCGRRGFLPLRSDDEDEHDDEETATLRFRVRNGEISLGKFGNTRKHYFLHTDVIFIPVLDA